MKFARTIILILLISSLLLGCTSKEISEADLSENTIDITIVGGSPAGVFFMLSNGISECINSSYPGSVVLIIPGASATNPIRISNHDGDAGLMMNTSVIAAKNGEDPYDEKIDNLAAIGSFYQTAYQFVVSKDLGISTFDEIIENKMKVRLSIGQAGSNSSEIFERILESYGVTTEEMEDWGAKFVRKNNEESASMLSEGSIDGMGITNLFPSPHIVESSLTKDLVLPEINSDIIQEVSKKYGYSVCSIPKDSYDFLSQDYATLSMNVLLCASTEMNDETAYKIARSIVENIENMQNVHSALKGITPEFLSQSYGVDLHPGALKYYKEIGVIQ